MIKNRQAMTLMEMLFVVILVGVLMTLAFSKLFKMIEYTRSLEAVNIIGNIKSALDRCWLKQNSYNGCTDGGGWEYLGMEDPSYLPNSHFSYQVDLLATPYLFNIIAQRNLLDEGDENDLIYFTYYEDGSIDKSGTGNFQNIR